MAATARRYIARLAAMTTLSGITALGVQPLSSGAATPKRSAAGTGADDPQSQEVATLVVEKQDVEIRRDGADTFKDAKDGAELHEGDTVRTDDTGRATIEYTDESFTRLDVNTEFTIVELTDDQGNRHTTGSLSSGQVWNRVEDLSESDKFETQGAGATAAVVGTAYVEQCLFDGTVCIVKGVVHDVDVSGNDPDTSVGELQKLVVQDGRWEDVEVMSLQEFYGDEWIQKNLEIDIALGFESPDWMKSVIVRTNPDGTVEVLGIVVTAPPPSGGGGSTPQDPPGGGEPPTDPPTDPPPPPPPPTNLGNGFGAGGGTNGQNGGASFSGGNQGHQTGNGMSQGAGQGHGQGQPTPTNT